MTTQSIPESYTRFDSVLRFAAARGISDVHFKAGQMPLYRRQGQLSTRQDEAHFSENDLHAITGLLLDPSRETALLQHGMVTFTHDLVGGGRFRVTVLRQRGQDAVAVRVLPTKTPTWRDLRLPPDRKSTRLNSSH